VKQPARVVRRKQNARQKSRIKLKQPESKEVKGGGLQSGVGRLALIDFNRGEAQSRST